MYKQKLESLNKELKTIELYIIQLKNNPAIKLSEIKEWEIKFKRTMIRYRTLLINNNEAA